MTDTFSFAVSFSNNIYQLAFTDAATSLIEIPVAQMVIKTHPTAANLYYLGTSQNQNTVDYTLCTNLTTASRVAQIAAIIALAAGSPIGSVTISGQPISITPTINLGETYALSNTRASSGNALVLRPNGTTARLLAISAATNTALSSGTDFYIKSGTTVTGGTWSAVSNPESKMQINAGGTVSAGDVQVFYYLGTSSIADISSYNLTYTTLQPIVVGLDQSGIGTTSVSLMWTELP